MADHEAVIKNGAPMGPRFYGRRKGRPLRASMKRLLDEDLPQFAFDPTRLIDDQFGRKADRFLEIGFGGGEHLAGLAATMPDSILLGPNLLSMVLPACFVIFKNNSLAISASGQMMFV